MLINSTESLIQAAELEAARIVEAARAESVELIKASRAQVERERENTILELSDYLLERLSNLEGELAETVRVLAERVIEAELYLQPQTLKRKATQTLEQLGAKVIKEVSLRRNKTKCEFTIETSSGETAKLLVDPISELNKMIDEAISRNSQ